MTTRFMVLVSQVVGLSKTPNLSQRDDEPHVFPSKCTDVHTTVPIVLRDCADFVAGHTAHSPQFPDSPLVVAQWLT
jgi:hypothetical protein